MQVRHGQRRLAGQELERRAVGQLDSLVQDHQGTFGGVPVWETARMYRGSHNKNTTHKFSPREVLCFFGVVHKKPHEVGNPDTRTGGNYT